MYGANNGRQQMQMEAASPVQQAKVSQQSSQGITTTQQGANLTVSSSEDIVTTSQKPKKVGGSFQWPPPKEAEDQGATATPMYIDPGTTGLLGSTEDDATSQPQTSSQPNQHNNCDTSMGKGGPSFQETSMGQG